MVGIDYDSSYILCMAVRLEWPIFMKIFLCIKEVDRKPIYQENDHTGKASEIQLIYHTVIYNICIQSLSVKLVYFIHWLNTAYSQCYSTQ